MSTLAEALLAELEPDDRQALAVEVARYRPGVLVGSDDERGAA